MSVGICQIPTCNKQVFSGSSFCGVRHREYVVFTSFNEIISSIAALVKRCVCGVDRNHNMKNQLSVVKAVWILPKPKDRCSCQYLRATIHLQAVSISCGLVHTLTLWLQKLSNSSKNHGGITQKGLTYIMYTRLSCRQHLGKHTRHTGETLINYWCEVSLIVYRTSVENQRGLPMGNQCRRWHGSQRDCDIGDQGKADLCNSGKCSICGIIRTSYQVSKAQRNISFGR